MSGQNCIHIERTYDYRPEELYSAWTSGEYWARWMGPEGFSVPNCSVDAREGGTFRCTMRSPKGEEHTVTGEFRSVKPNHIAMTWGWETDGQRGHESMVEVGINRDGNRSTMVFDHCGFDNDESRDSHEEGWLSSFEKFGTVLKS